MREEERSRGREKERGRERIRIFFKKSEFLFFSRGLFEKSHPELAHGCAQQYTITEEK